MSYPRNANTAAYPATRFDSNTFLNPESIGFGGITSGDGPQTAPFLQHSLLNFFSEFDAIVTRELRLPAAGRQH
jgi:hypothetical protein